MTRPSTAALVLLAGAAAVPAAASDVPDRFRVEVGGFRIGADTNLTFTNGQGATTPISFESLEVPESATRFYVEGFWRPGRRHQVSLSWYRNGREGPPRTLQRDVTWGGRVITAGATANAQVSSTYLSGVYRFAVYKNETFEIGPSVGIGHLTLEAGIAGTASAQAAPGTVSGPFDIAKDLSQPTGDVGGYFYWWPAGRVLLRGDMRYIVVSPGDSEASVTDGRGSVLYHPWRSLGLGVQYTYTRFRYDREAFSRELGGRLRYSGFQVVLSAAF
jgi:hypothetical protein